MKTIIALIFSFSFHCAFAQNVTNQSALHLKNEVKLTSWNPELPNLYSNYAEPQKKNPGLAIIYSLLLPGMGELYAESYESGKYFTIAEGILWGTYIGINTYGNWQKDRYKSFAAVNGQVNVADKDENYFATISEYLNIEQYNNQQALERNFTKMLDEDKYYWNWQSEDRKAYRNMWVSSEEAFNNLRFVVGALIVNRIASAINAVRLVSAFNKREAAELSWNISAKVDNSILIPNHFVINFQHNF
jgi:hypothetical protein